MIKDCICKDCGNKFKGGPRAWFCPSCRHKRFILRHREEEQRRRNGTTRKIGSTDYCEVCKKLYVVSGGNQRYCEECAPIAIMQKDRELSLDYYNRNKNDINNKRCNKRRKDYEEFMENKDYCTQKGVACSECSLASFGRDCQNKTIRTDALNKSDKRYREKVDAKETSISFYLTKKEADDIKLLIKKSGLTKAGFLRKLIELYKNRV